MAKYGVEDGEVKLSDIQVLENDREIEKQRNKETKGANDTNNTNDTNDKTICEDRCGDGECQEFVCMAIGCPCVENKESCPEDCNGR